ncbi:ABC transporter ATP-binding protein [Providencia sneebia]|uniref:ABC transporter ATP-binding protein n=1 Tax=Providencia sneebia DSM 19967 TaxID=1141660 RepID=K8WHU2_9GAMM|nr:ABC transporter ATP-binding protein [Providencia sneebia]EKT60148.1 hypothetical protein OO7_04954 [Providencia sneebia DSM 19967]
MTLFRLIKQYLPTLSVKMWQKGAIYRLIDALMQFSQLIVAIWVIISFYGRPNNMMPWIAFAILLCILIIRLYIVAKAVKLLTLAAYQLGINIRRQLLYHLVSLPLTTIQKIKAGNIARTLSDDMQWIENQAAYTSIQIGCQLVLFLAVYLVIFSLNWIVGLSACSMLVLGGILFVFFKNKIHKLLELRSEKMGEITDSMIEYAQGIAFIRTSGINTTVQQRFDLQIDSLRQGFRRSIIANTPIVGLLYIIIDSSVAIGIIACAYQFTSTDTASIFQAIIILLLLFTTIIPLRGAIALLNLSTLANIGIDNIKQLKNQPKQPSGNRVNAIEHCDVRVNHISYCYPSSTNNALEDISFYAPQGSVTAIVGTSGSGKSTLMHLLLAFYTPDQGEISFGGIPLANYQLQRFYDSVTMVFQETLLFQDSVENNLRIAKPDATDAELVDVTKAVNLHDTIMKLPLGYQTVLGVEGGTLSGGERQRLAIARALLKSSPIIFLDEATASLDPENENIIQQAIKTLSDNKTVFIIAHRLKTITQADQILVLDQGRLQDCADHQTLLLRCDLYRTLWEHQNKALKWNL